MPSALYGFSGDEVIAHIQDFTGNYDSEFRSFLVSALPLAEFRYCKLHDWRFLNKQNLALQVTSGTDEYFLTVDTLGYYMQAEDIKRVFSPAHNRYLVRRTLDELRLFDPNQNDGHAGAELQFYAPVGDNSVVVWPRVFKDTELRIDGKVTPSALLTSNNYPTIPFSKQDSFIAYLLAIALERENDNRAAAKKEEALALIQQDINNDMGGHGNSGQPRIRSPFEVPDNVFDLSFDPLNMRRP